MGRFHFPLVPPIPGVSEKDWNDWIWQSRHSSQPDSPWLKLSPEEKEALQSSGAHSFSFRLTPYYSCLINWEDLDDPIRRIAVPNLEESNPKGQHLFDPLAEKEHQVTSRLIHRYSDRVLLWVTDFCNVYCRYCTRKHFTAKNHSFVRKDDYQEALEYIRSHPGIREVILSGGDPLTIDTEKLGQILKDLRSIDHIEVIRIGSRVPVVCPMRIDQGLVTVLREYKPIFLMTHFNHPRELTQQAAEALELLVDHGIPVMNQMVLLRGVNNHPNIIQALNRRLVYLRVKPYYLFQCDPSQGSEHFRTSIDEGEEILRELWGHLSGLAMPTLSLDIPEGGGKVTLVPTFEVERSSDGRWYRGWDGRNGFYANPNHERKLPSDWMLFEGEWNLLKNAKKQLHDGES